MCLRFVFLLATRLAAWLRLSRREQTWKTAEILILCVPKTSSTSCDQAVFVDQAADVSPLSDAVLVEVCRFG
jgi:hypothetical protein